MSGSSYSSCPRGTAFEQALGKLTGAHEAEVLALQSEIAQLTARLARYETLPSGAPGARAADEPSHRRAPPAQVQPQAPPSDFVLPQLPGAPSDEPAAGDRVSDYGDCGANGRHSNEGGRSGVVSKWSRLVEGLLVEQQKSLEVLHEVWNQPDSWVRHVRWNNQGVDLWGELQNSLRVGRQGIRMHGSIFTQAHDMHVLKKRRAVGHWSYISQNGLKAFLERHVVVEPQAPTRIAWASIGVALMGYDIVVLPMQAFELGSHWLFDTVSWGAQIFWSMDIVFSFFTGVYVKAELSKKLEVIAQSYATSWLLFDIAVVCPLWLVLLLSGDDSQISGMRAVRYIRMLRFLRLMRIAKFERMLSDALAAINSPDLLLVLGMIKLMVAMILTSHVNACIWYWVGGRENGGWIETVEQRSILYKYFTSMHWALTQFQGTSEVTPGETTGERIYAVLLLLCSLLILSTFVSSLTNLMMQLQNLHSERNFTQRAVRSYLCANGISNLLSTRVKRYVEWKLTVSKRHDYDKAVCSILPRQLLMDVHSEVRLPSLEKHRFFARFVEVYQRQSRRLCHEALHPLSPAPQELIFSVQETCHRMYFMVSGELTYTAMSLERVTSRGSSITFQPPVHVESGQYLSEPALWMHWQHRGELVVGQFASLLVLSTEEFGLVMCSHPPALASCVLYARRYLNGVNRFSSSLTDVINPIQIIAEEDVTDLLSVLADASISPAQPHFPIAGGFPAAQAPASGRAPTSPSRILRLSKKPQSPNP